MLNGAKQTEPKKKSIRKTITQTKLYNSRPKPCPFLEPPAPISTLTRLFISYNRPKITIVDENTFDSHAHALSIMEKSMHV